MSENYIAIDWGSTHLRAWRVQQGKCTDTIRNEKRNFKKVYRAPDVRLPEQFSLIGKLRAHYPVATLCHVFGVHRNSYKYRKTALKSRTAGEPYYNLR